MHIVYSNPASQNSDSIISTYLDQQTRMSIASMEISRFWNDYCGNSWSAYQRREPRWLNLSPTYRKETTPYQVVSPVLNFLRPFIQESIAVSMNHHTGQTRELHMSYLPKRKEWLYWDKFCLVYSGHHVDQVVTYTFV